jgi:hypothetical protein
MKVSVSGKQFIFPRTCACCGGYPLTHLQVSGTERNLKARTRGWVWDVPYCVNCKRHIRAIEGTSLVILFLVGAAGVFGFCITFFTRNAFFGLVASGLVFAILILVYMVARCHIRKSLHKNCTGLGRAVSYQGSSGSCHTFDIQSLFYAAEFVRSNKTKLVNVSLQVASILRGAKFGEHQVPRRLIRKNTG